MKRVLVVLPFENLFPPMNGGMQRGMNLLHQLSRSFEVTTIVRQDEHSFGKAQSEFPHLKSATVVSTKSAKRHRDLFSLLPSRIANALRYRYWNRSIKGSASLDFLTIYPVLKNVLRTKQFDYILFEDISLLNLSKLVRRHQKNVRIIYDAYNVNSRLALAAMKNGTGSRKEYELIRDVESTLTHYVDRVFTCSELDLSQLIEMNDGKLEGMVIPNGTGIIDVPGTSDPVVDPSDKILFCGSMDYSPNREGLLWFCKEVLPILAAKRPSVRVMVVGKGDPGEELKAALMHNSIDFYGMVESVSDYYRKSVLAIVPLLSGSGTRLKLLEAMANKVAVVSTSTGAEGIDYTDGKNILIADDGAAFANAILELLSKKELAIAIATEAFTFVKTHYDWNAIGDKLSKTLI